VLDEIRAVVISKAMGKKTLWQLAKQMYGLYGPYNFIKVGSKFVRHKLLARRQVIPHSKTGRPRAHSVKQVFEQVGIPVIERNDINSGDFLREIEKYDADLFVSVASPIIFKNALIATPQLDCINIHNAPLPNYRGMLPNFWQLYNDKRLIININPEQFPNELKMTLILL